jgi:hypothetical protein
MFFLKPCETTKFVILYCYGILVHAVCVMSNHIHMVVTDLHRKLTAPSAGAPVDDATPYARSSGGDGRRTAQS